MKKIFTLLFFASVFKGTAQPIPNAGFESWVTIGGWYENPVNWQTNNNQLIVPVVQGSPYQGNYSMQLNQNGWAKTVFSLSQKPSLVQWYMKSNLPAADSCVFRVLLYSSGVAVDSGRTVNSVSFNAWTLQSIAISQFSQAADSMEIIVTAGTKTGTLLYVDEFSYSITGMHEYMSQIDLRVFPVPAKEQVTFSLEQQTGEDYLLMLSNNNGEVIDKAAFGNCSEIKLQTADLPRGFYYYRLYLAGVEKSRGKIFIN